MPITKKDLLELQKNIFLETSNFLEKNLIEPFFDLKKDVGILKKDVGVLKKDVKELKHDVIQINRKLDNFIINRADRHAKKLDNHEKRITSLETSNLT